MNCKSSPGVSDEIRSDAPRDLLSVTKEAGLAVRRYSTLQVLRWLRWLARNDLALLAHIAVLVLFGMSFE